MVYVDKVGVIVVSAYLSQLVSAAFLANANARLGVRDVYLSRSFDGLTQLFHKDWPLNLSKEISFVFQNDPQFLHAGHMTGFGELECSFQCRGPVNHNANHRGRRMAMRAATERAGREG
jgi:hypothetical protein